MALLTMVRMICMVNWWSKLLSGSSHSALMSTITGMAVAPGGRLALEAPPCLTAPVNFSLPQTVSVCPTALTKTTTRIQPSKSEKWCFWTERISGSPRRDQEQHCAEPDSERRKPWLGELREWNLRRINWGDFAMIQESKADVVRHKSRISEQPSSVDGNNKTNHKIRTYMLNEVNKKLGDNFEKWRKNARWFFAKYKEPAIKEMGINNWHLYSLRWWRKPDFETEALLYLSEAKWRLSTSTLQVFNSDWDRNATGNWKPEQRLHSMKSMENGHQWQNFEVIISTCYKNCSSVFWQIRGQSRVSDRIITCRNLHSDLMEVPTCMQWERQFRVWLWLNVSPYLAISCWNTFWHRGWGNLFSGM